MKILKCPKCGSTKIEIYAGLITGSYHCEKCGYIGPIVVEEDVDVNK